MGIRITYTVQSCPRCGKRLLRQDAGTIRIGSPLLHCRKCDQYYRTNMRQEWCHMQGKAWHFLRWPVLLAILFGISMTFTAKHILGLLAGALGGIVFGLVFCIPDLCRLVSSLVRMRNPDHLRRLRDHGIISPDEYEDRLDARIK